METNPRLPQSNRHWQINTNYSWLHMENPVLAAPEHKLMPVRTYARTLGPVYRYTIREGASYLSHPGQGEAGKLRTLELRANYRLCSFADVFVKGENLLAQRYEINAGFPMPKATVMGGVNINF